MASSSNDTLSGYAAGVRGDTPAARTRPTAVIGVTGALLGAGALFAGPFLSFRPNRVVDGVASTGLEAFGAVGWALLATWVVAGALAFVEPGRRTAVVRGLIAACALGVTLWASGLAATEYASAEGAIARTSFGWSFYVTLLAVYLVQHAALEDSPGMLARAAIVWSDVLVIVALVASGLLADLGIAREFALARDLFAREFRTHIFYALGATAAAVAIGVPLGIIAARNRRFETPLMGALNLGQVFPALAFVGLMMPVFGALGRNVAPLGSIGVAGIGWAPVFVVLLVYALFPVVRNTIVAIRSLDPGVLDAARGVGMSPRRLFAEIELPLGFPVVLAGVRVALVQSTAGAVLAAFVGGGGLGTIMFFGLEQTSMDLVLVGVVPIVALALLFDTGLRGVERLAGGSGEAA